jgi:hypothetical protein
MSKKNNLYITFPDTLEGMDKDLQELMDTYISNFENVLLRIAGNELDIVKKGKDFNQSNYFNYLSEAARVVFFVHPEFMEDEDYVREIKDFCETTNLEKTDFYSGTPKIFKVVLHPLKDQLQPYCLESLLPYDFYERNIYNRRLINYNFETEEKKQIIYSKLLDLAYDISASLKGESTKIFNPDDTEKFVYLGLTTFDQQNSRDLIRRELQHYGYKVLPGINMPLTGEEFKESLLENLKFVDTVIQLMGSNYGDLLKGTKYSVIDYQNNIIKEYQEQNANENFKRYIWIPQQLKISDQRQALYLKRLRRDDAGPDTEIIESPLETFKTILASRMLVRNNGQGHEIENISKIYLISEEEAVSSLDPLYSTLSLSGLKVYTMDYEEQVGIYARHLRYLRDCDGIIIMHQSNNNYWLSSKLRDLIKSQGLGRKRPFKKIVISSSSEPDEQLLKMIRAKKVVLNSRDYNPELILEKLISE